MNINETMLVCAIVIPLAVYLFLRGMRSVIEDASENTRTSYFAVEEQDTYNGDWNAVMYSYPQYEIKQVHKKFYWMDVNYETIENRKAAEREALERAIYQARFEWNHRGETPSIRVLEFQKNRYCGNMGGVVVWKDGGFV